MMRCISKYFNFVPCLRDVPSGQLAGLLLEFFSQSGQIALGLTLPVASVKLF